MIDINPPPEAWSVRRAGPTAEVTVGHYTQYFVIQGSHTTPCDPFGTLEPPSSYAAHKLPTSVERRVRSLLKRKETP